MPTYRRQDASAGVANVNRCAFVLQIYNFSQHPTTRHPRCAVRGCRRRQKTVVLGRTISCLGNPCDLCTTRVFTRESELVTARSPSSWRRRPTLLSSAYTRSFPRRDVLPRAAHVARRDDEHDSRRNEASRDDDEDWGWRRGHRVKHSRPMTTKTSPTMSDSFIAALYPQYGAFSLSDDRRDERSDASADLRARQVGAAQSVRLHAGRVRGGRVDHPRAPFWSRSRRSCSRASWRCPLPREPTWTTPDWAATPSACVWGGARTWPLSTSTWDRRCSG